MNLINYLRLATEYDDSDYLLGEYSLISPENYEGLIIATQAISDAKSEILPKLVKLSRKFIKSFTQLNQ
jgi:hypothetical protein